MIEVTNPRALKAFEDRIETLEREKQIALEKAAKPPARVRPFAEVFEHTLRFLANPHKLWENGSPDLQKILLRLSFGTRPTYDRKTGCLNTQKSTIFEILEDACIPSGKLVGPAGGRETAP